MVPDTFFLSSDNKSLLSVLNQQAQSVHQSHLLDRAAAGLKESWRADEKREALRAQDHDVETIARE